MKVKATKLNGGGHHPGDEDLLSLLDGELEPRQSEVVRSHLEACWTCRARTEKFQNAINSFVEYRHLVLNPSLKRPEKQNDFQARFKSAKFHQEPTKSFFGKWLETFSNGFKFLSPVYLKFGIPLIAVVVIVALLLNQSAVQTVSAAELLKHSDEAQKTALSKTSNPVVYQKFQVRRTKKDSSIESVDWETWKDTVGKNFRDAIENKGVRQLIVDRFADKPTKVPHILENERPAVLSELAQILQLNGLNPKDPLSSASFRSWRDSLTRKHEVVNKTATENNEESFELKVTPLGELSNGQIIEANYLVRANDWTPLKLRLDVKENSEVVTFEIVRQNSEVISLNQLSPEIFPKVQIVNLPSPTASPSASASPTLSPTVTPEIVENNNSNVAPSPITSPVNNAKITASAELEVEVLQLLNNAKADLGEEITVKRENGVLYVRGLVETSGRKTEILNALQSVRQNPAVKIELQTVAEAVAKQKNQPSNKPTSVENLETNNLSTAAENDLVQHFGSEAEARSFAARTVNRSGQAMSYVFAMRRLSRQFSPAELQKLSPQAKAKLVNLIISHARNFKAANENLSRDLAAVFNEPKVSGSVNIEVNSLDDLPRVIESLFSLASTNDRLIRSALTISASDTKISALRAAQFWQSLKNAELLASKIAALK